MKIACPSCGTANRVPDERIDDHPVCGRCGTSIAEPEPVSLSDASFDAYLTHNDQPVVVDFWAEWCGPCQMMAPQFKAAAQQLPQVRFAKLETDPNPKASLRHRIRSIPTMVVFHRGEEVARQSGAMSAGAIAKWVQQVVGPQPLSG